MFFTHYIVTKDSGFDVTDELVAIHTDAFDLDGNVGDGAGDYDPSPPDGMEYDGGTENDSDDGFIGAAFFGAYKGTGTFVIDAAVDQWSDFGGVSGIEYAVSPSTADGTVTVIYSWHEIPEPATMSLLALGGLAMLRRKRR